MTAPRGTRGSGRRRRGENGATAVEFALVFTLVLVPLVLGLLQYGWYFYTSQVTGNAVREVARRLAVGDCTTGAQDYARAQSISSLTLTYGTPGATAGTVAGAGAVPDPGSVLRVRGELAASAQLFEFLPLPNDGTVVRTVDTRVEDDTQDSPCT